MAQPKLARWPRILEVGALTCVLQRIADSRNGDITRILKVQAQHDDGEQRTQMAMILRAGIIVQMHIGEGGGDDGKEGRRRRSVCRC